MEKSSDKFVTVRIMARNVVWSRTVEFSPGFRLYGANAWVVWLDRSIQQINLMHSEINFELNGILQRLFLLSKAFFNFTAIANHFPILIFFPREQNPLFLSFISFLHCLLQIFFNPFLIITDVRYFIILVTFKTRWLNLIVVGLMLTDGLFLLFVK